MAARGNLLLFLLVFLQRSILKVHLLDCCVNASTRIGDGLRIYRAWHAGVVPIHRRLTWQVPALDVIDSFWILLKIYNSNAK